MPFSEKHNVDHPVSLYAATKKSNELMAHCYSHLYGIPTTGLRFFTVYGPWGRPDMAPMIFAKAILKNEPINLFNNGVMIRDFTYIDDIVEGIKIVIFNQDIPSGEIYNIGNGKQVGLMEFIDRIGKELNREPVVNFVPPHPADVLETWSNTNKLQKLGYEPMVDIKEGVANFMEWYKDYMGVN